MITHNAAKRAQKMKATGMATEAAKEANEALPHPILQWPQKIRPLVFGLNISPSVVKLFEILDC